MKKLLINFLWNRRSSIVVKVFENTCKWRSSFMCYACNVVKSELLQRFSVRILPINLKPILRIWVFCRTPILCKTSLNGYFYNKHSKSTSFCIFVSLEFSTFLLSTQNIKRVHLHQLEISRIYFFNFQYSSISISRSNFRFSIKFI